MALSAGLASLALLSIFVAGPAQAAVFIVTSTNNNGGGTLRQAITNANGSAGADVICFNLGGGLRTIALTSSLPQITEAVTIDAPDTLGDATCTPHTIEINGALAGAAVGLDVAAGGGGTKIIGLVIDQFASYGIRLSSSGNFVQGCYIGVDPTGALTGRGNITGIYITGSNNQIDGTTAAGRNVISGNTNDGIQIDGSAGASGNVVKGSYIGVNAAGNAALKNGGQGVIIYLGAASNTIGGNTPVWPGAGNLISGNGNIGIAINNPGTTLNVVRGNRIGTDATGAIAIGNLGRGVSLDQGAAGNTIGGPTVGDGNTIANSGSNGVWMGGNATVSNSILGNNIFASGAVASPIPGIDLNGNGVDINDTGDLDTVPNEGSNRTQNHPVLTAAMTNGVGSATFAGSLNSKVGSYRVEFFANTAADATGYGEGQRYLGSTNVTTNGSGNAIIGVTLAPIGGLLAGEFVSSTATACTDGAPCTTFGDTSEFGGCVIATASLVVTTTADTLGGTTTSVANLIATPGPDGRISLREAILAANANASADVIRFGIPIADTGHIYYQDNGFPSSLGIPTQTTLADQSTPSSPTITNYDADYPAGKARSWYRIQVTSPLPNIVFPVTLDATTQPLSTVFPSLELDGTSAGAGVAGLTLGANSNGSTIRGFVINRFSDDGIIITASNGNTVDRSYLGTDVSGTIDRGNTIHGIQMRTGSANNVIGSTTAGAGNVISGNDVNGVDITAASNNQVLGNIIGLDVTGTVDVGNTFVGVGVGLAATGNIVGDVGNGRNIISGNNQFGVRLVDTGTSNNRVQNNYIGLDITGTLARGNSSDGVRLEAAAVATGNIIGGTSAGLGNVISANNGPGVQIRDFMQGTVIVGNTIGRNAANTAALLNAGAGVLVADTVGATTSATIGGTGANDPNIIASNGGAGIALTAGGGFTPTGISILRNSIFNNGGLGIDLGNDGVTLNDAFDSLPGPNNLLNYPLITRSFASAGNLAVNFKLDVAAGSYRIEFYKNPSGLDGSGFGEGQTFASAVNVTHPGGGPVFFGHTFPGVGTDVITATTIACTDGAVCAAFGNTSEFAKNMAAATTAVELMSFTATARDQAVELSWQTASELQNLGFHVYRSSSASGPFGRITPALIPGLGSSPTGTTYSYRDTGLTNGAQYFYKLEDIETTGRAELHGPVSATPVPDDQGDGEGEGTPANPSRVAYGDPSAVSLRILEHDSTHALLELKTGGFFATPNEDGSVDLEIPTFEDQSRPGQPKIPTRRAWVEAVAGRKVQITSVEAQDAAAFPNLRPAPAPASAIDVTREGTVRPGRVPRREGVAFRGGSFPRIAARVLGTAFQVETKKAELELAPLRFTPTSGLVLSRRLLVRVAFAGRETVETSRGGARGRRLPAPRVHTGRSPLVQLVVRDKGLYKVPFEDVFPGRRADLLPSSLFLSRKGESVAFFVDHSHFGPGSSLYFLSEGASLNPDAQEAVYELTRKSGGLGMSVTSGAPQGGPTAFYWQHLLLEQNKTYQSGLLDAPDPWLWRSLVSPATQSYPFTVDQLVATSAPGRLTVWLQGASDFDADPDHHIRLSLNGTPLGEASWDGKTPKTIEAEITPGVLVEGANTLEIENLGDTGAAYSMVLLDKFSLDYPRATSAVAGVLEGSFTESGTVEVAGLGADSILLDTTEKAPRWLTGATAESGSLRFRAEPGHRYFVAAASALKRPSLRHPGGAALKSRQNQADYLLVAPREFLATAEPLLALRQRQGLRTRAVAIEDVASAFGSGEEGPQALQDFLSYAYHSWKAPSPRYVLLLGDATYDPKDYLHTGVKNRVPPLMARTTYLLTASDPAYAALNGDDLLPDLALGRLPAATVEEARIMVDKVVAFETAGRDLSGPAVLVADNADLAGNFEANANDLAETVLAGRSVDKVFLSEKGAATRAEIAHAFDRGASVLSYVGHGGVAVWASENVWNNLDVNTLAPQPQQPILFTLNCLNGFFHFPPLNSLAEQFLKAEGKGAVAAFSPSGLSLDEPAHVLHKALLSELLSGRHERLGDAMLAAQGLYADSGALPELLSIYHLFGDPAMRIR